MTVKITQRLNTKEVSYTKETRLFGGDCKDCGERIGCCPAHICRLLKHQVEGSLSR